MTDLHAEHINALSSLIMSRMIYRRLRNRPDLIEQIAAGLEAVIKSLDPQKVASYAHEWLQVLGDPGKLKAVMTGSGENDLWLRKSKPFHASAVGLDFTDIEWRKRMRLAARRIAAREVENGRTWSISGFQMFTAYPSPESSEGFCSFEEIKEITGKDGVMVLRALESRPSYRRADVDMYRDRQLGTDRLVVETNRS
ncbi:MULTISPECIES: hypothetical protein [Sinorhizobium]|uniref:hypothetical protein n=1 Tax=Sinorhizobium TaxID=28105 RepID=UPI00119D4D70|nr:MULTISPECIES: hypothetical protein [Sinorhizobium]MDW9439228.1 hypothetical protein [Sinorhizobium meliloti]MDW9484051.1 hypothetical protein [Sinorhizobium meliloti]MDX0525155.1 hypothetical protein [Sinorhizobium medicae]MDX0636675.1 hypothetical protein [Sinorhizobium medicae]MQV61367.1 hypothetical protein [Sinorhizobium meliloti]